MPERRDRTAKDRASGTRTNTHPRANGDIILTPDDILEGAGSFVDVDPSGDPLGFNLGRVELPTGRHVYVGTTPNSVQRQTINELPYDRPSHRVDYVITDGPSPPSITTPAPLLAQIPPPSAPTLYASTATNIGYPASTPTSPYWFSWGYYVNGRLTGYAPPVSFHLEFGQSVRVPLPESLPEGVYQIALLMSAPGWSSVNGPTAMYIQRILDMRSVRATTYELTGPFRKEGGMQSETDTSVLSPAQAPSLVRIGGPYGARVGQYRAMVTWADATGETMMGALSAPVTISLSTRYSIYEPPDMEGAQPTLTFPAGEGAVRITRPPAPPGATGWRCYLYIDPLVNNLGYSAGWRKVVDKVAGRGDALPFKIGRTELLTSGWEGSEEHHAANDGVVCIDTDLPSENSTGVGTPEDRPEVPVPFGASRPLPGRYYVKVTDTVNGIETLPSPAASIDIASNEVFSVAFAQEENVVTNPAFTETDQNLDPQFWTFSKTNGYAQPGVNGEDLLIGTSAATAGPSPTATSQITSIDKTKRYYFDVWGKLETPINGAQAGTVEIVRITTHTSGTQETILASHTSLGEFHTSVEFPPAGSGGSFPWHADALSVQIQFRFTGASRNARLRVEEVNLRDKKARPRRAKTRPTAPFLPLPQEYPRIEDPPAGVVPPDTQNVPAPDRPLSTGTTLQTLLYNQAALEAGFTSQTAGGATLTNVAAALLEGTRGQRALKSASGAGAFAYTQKTFAPDTGYAARHGLGISMKNKLNVMPSNGRVNMHALARPSDGAAFAWLEAGNQAEQQSLTITGQPQTTGNVGINLAGTNTNVSVLGAHEVKQVNVTGAPTAPGTITITLDNAAHYVQAGGGLYRFSITVTSGPWRSDWLEFYVDGILSFVPVTAGMTTTQVAQEFLENAHFGWTVTRSGSTVTFTAQEPGPHGTPTVNLRSTGTAVTINVLDPGNAETATQLATRIRDSYFPNWTTGGSGTSITFTAATAGPRTQISASAGSSGATLTTATNTSGSIDSPTDLATRIRGTTFTGWTTGGTGTNVTFTATAAGPKSASSYQPNATGATGTMSTTTRGTSGTLMATVKDAQNVTRQRLIMDGLTTSTVFNTDIAVSGAGTDKAIVSFWASTDTNALTLRARFEDIDLTGYPAGMAKIGVVSDSATALTWDLFSDAGAVTNLGLSYYRDHNGVGEYLPQLAYYAREGQPARQDLLLQDGRAAVIPGGIYTLSAYARASVGTVTPARLLTITAHPDFTYDGTLTARESESTLSPLGGLDPSPAERHYLADVSNTTGVTGVVGWTHYQTQVTIPDGCHAVSLASRDIGAGEIILQEVVLSPGSTPKRTNLYQLSGSYNRIFDLQTPNAQPPFHFWSRKRLDLGGVVDAPTGTTVTTTYRAAHASAADPSVPDAATWSSYVSDPTTVPDRAFVQINYALTGSGLLTPVVGPNAPRAEWALTLGSSTPSRRMSTLLRADRSELPGGVAFARLSEWHFATPEGRRLLPSGRLHDDHKLFEPVGHLPETEIFVYSDAARRILEERWKDAYVAEIYGRWILTLKLSAKPEFSREAAVVTEDDDGLRHSLWKATLAPSEVVEAVQLPLASLE